MTRSQAWQRSWLLALGVAAVTGGDAACAQDALADDEIATAIRRGLDFLARVQEDDGGFPRPPLQGHDRFCDTALAALAMLAHGERLDGGAHHPALRSAVRSLQSAIPEEGPIRVQSPRRGDWQHFETWYAGFAGLLFAELQLRAPDDDLGATLRQLRRRIVALQKNTGGWCHDLQPRVRDIPGLGRAEYSDDLASVGALCVAALDAMTRAGLADDDGAAARGFAWLMSLQNSDGGFAYGRGHTWPDAAKSEPGRTAGALWAALPRLSPHDPRCLAAMDYLDRRFADLPFSDGHGGKPFVVSYAYGGLACGRLGPAARRRFLAVHGRELLRRQRADGSFALGDSLWDTAVNATAFALLALAGGDLALDCQRPATGDDDVARSVHWLRDQRRIGGAFDGRWGDRSTDLALTGAAAAALWAADPIGGRDEALASARWLAAEIEALAAVDFATTTRSHLSFQLPIALPLLLRARDEPANERAAARIVAELAASQAEDGGWSYDRQPLYTLLSTTSAIVLALEQARAAGVAVPDATLERAVAYVEACAGEGGGFRYCPDPQHPILAQDRARYRREEVARTIVAVAALHAAGRDGTPVHTAGVAFLERELTAAALPADDHHLWFTLHQGLSLHGAVPEALWRRFAGICRERADGLRRDDGGIDWPGMAWSGLLGRPPMYPVFAAAAALHVALATRR